MASGRDNPSRRIIIVGGHELACLCLEALAGSVHEVVLCIGRKDDESVDGIFPSLLLRAQGRNIPSLKPDNLNDPAVLKVVERTRADIVLSLQNNMIFGKQWLDMFSRHLGIVNAHFAPLPRYAGYWPELWAIWNEEKAFGVTIHYVAEAIDSGRIIAQYPVTVEADETRKSLYEKCTAVCFRMIQDYLDRVLKEQVAGIEQDSTHRSYYPRKLPNDGFVDLSWGREKIERYFRAISFAPFAGPKLRIGTTVISTLDMDLPFFTPIEIQVAKYDR